VRLWVTPTSISASDPYKIEPLSDSLREIAKEMYYAERVKVEDVLARHDRIVGSASVPTKVLLAGDGEDALVGSSVALGDAVLDIGMRIERCVMTTRPQAGGIARDLDVLRTIARERDACLAVGALVTRPGTIRTGDALRLMVGSLDAPTARA
jgi:uncharacterized protein YcbX